MGFFDPIDMIKKHVLAHVFSTVFFVLELSMIGAMCFHVPTGAVYVAFYVGFVPSKNI